MADDSAYSSVPGALVFWLYIVAALVFTAISINAIQSSKVSNLHSSRGQYFFALLALVSFSTLSFHMLDVLILSYRDWSQSRSVPLPDCIFGHGCLLGSERQPLHLWEWSKTSTLFQDFGTALVGTPARWAWCNASLALTYTNVAYMCVEGRQAGVPRLWAFIALAEILPISFAQNLLFLALIGNKPNHNRTILGSDLTWAISGLGYLVCLLVAPTAGTALISVIVVARLLLVMPLFMRTHPVASTVPTESLAATTTTNLLVVLLSLLRAAQAFQSQGPTEIAVAINSHPAVSALGYDFVISCVSWAAWYVLGSDHRTSSIKTGKEE